MEANYIGRVHDEKVVIRHRAESSRFSHNIHQCGLLATNHDDRDDRHVFCDREKPVSGFRYPKIKMPRTRVPGIWNLRIEMSPKGDVNNGK